MNKRTLHKGMSICACGSIDDALQVAEKLYVDAVKADCPVWALQVATFFRSMCIQVIKDALPEDPLLTKGLHEMVDALVRYQREHGSGVEELAKRAGVDRE